MPATRFDITLRRPLAEGRAFGAVGPYEELKGRLHFSVDPAHAANRTITDVDRAPREPTAASRSPPTCRCSCPSMRAQRERAGASSTW